MNGLAKQPPHTGGFAQGSNSKALLKTRGSRALAMHLCAQSADHFAPTHRHFKYCGAGGNSKPLMDSGVFRALVVLFAAHRFPDLHELG